MATLVLEFITGGGGYRLDDAELVDQLLPEGRAMVEAVVGDLAMITPVTQLVDSRLRDRISTVGTPQYVSSDAELREFLTARAGEFEYILLIAPESNGHLSQLAKQIREAGGRVLLGDAAFLAWASDKRETCAWLQSNGLPALLR